MYDEFSMNQALASFEKEIMLTNIYIERKKNKLDFTIEMIPRYKNSINTLEKLSQRCSEAIVDISSQESRTSEQEQDLIELHEAVRENAIKIEETRKEIKEAEENIPIIREDIKQLEERLAELNECKRKVLKKLNKLNEKMDEDDQYWCMKDDEQEQQQQQTHKEKKIENEFNRDEDIKIDEDIKEEKEIVVENSEDIECSNNNNNTIKKGYNSRCICDVYTNRSKISDSVVEGRIMNGNDNKSEYPSKVVIKKSIKSDRHAREKVAFGLLRMTIPLGLDNKNDESILFDHICKPISLCIKHDVLVFEKLEEVRWDDDIHLQPLNIHKMVIDILKGVKILHEMDIAHCDITPNNIMIRESNDKFNYVIADLNSSCYPASMIGLKGRKWSTGGWSRLLDEDDEYIDTLFKVDLMSIGVLIARMMAIRKSMLDWDDRWDMLEYHLEKRLKVLETMHEGIVVNDDEYSSISWNDEEITTAIRLFKVSIGFLSGKMDTQNAFDILSSANKEAICDNDTNSNSNNKQDE